MRLHMLSEQQFAKGVSKFLLNPDRLSELEALQKHIL
jgi:hypothetical protein